MFLKLFKWCWLFFAQCFDSLNYVWWKSYVSIIFHSLWFYSQKKHITISEETCVHHFNPELKWASKQWGHAYLTPTTKSSSSCICRWSHSKCFLEQTWYYSFPFSAQWWHYQQWQILSCFERCTYAPAHKWPCLITKALLHSHDSIECSSHYMRYVQQLDHSLLSARPWLRVISPYLDR